MKRKTRLMWGTILIVALLIAVGAILTSGDANAMGPRFFGGNPGGQGHQWSPPWGRPTPTSSYTPTQPPVATTAPGNPTPIPTTAPGNPTPAPVPTAPSVPAPNGSRAVTLTNNSSQTVWVVSTGNPGFTPPDGGTWQLAQGQSTTVDYPATWNGRIWGRTGCNFNGSQGTCATGDCGAGLTCPNTAGDLTSPTSLAEFNMQGSGIDYYDVSLVDGFNLPVTINVTSGQMGVPAGDSCITASCATNMDSASACPDVLQVKDGSGNVIGCNSACNVLHQDEYCCANAYATPATCNPTTWPVNYAAPFKQAVPYAYSYPFDDATSVFTCTNGCAYQIVFGDGS
jgi:hypothetical protein